MLPRSIPGTGENSRPFGDLRGFADYVLSAAQTRASRQGAGQCRLESRYFEVALRLLREGAHVRAPVRGFSFAVAGKPQWEGLLKALFCLFGR